MRNITSLFSSQSLYPFGAPLRKVAHAPKTYTAKKGYANIPNLPSGDEWTYMHPKKMMTVAIFDGDKVFEKVTNAEAFAEDFRVHEFDVRRALEAGYFFAVKGKNLYAVRPNRRAVRICRVRKPIK